MKPEDTQELRELIEFLRQYQVAEFDLDRGDVKIRLKFEQPAASSASVAELARSWASMMPSAAPLPAPPSGVPARPASLAEALPSAAGSAAQEEELHTVKSPIVGTFYASPSPGAGAFVAPGDHVEKGQVICIVEAMKLMNEIEADISGEIVKCLVTNGQPIEYGQPLFSIRQ